MKRILLTILLATVAATVSAQIGIGGQIDINTTGGSTHYNRVAPTAAGSYDYTVAGDNSLKKTTSITVLPEVDYWLNDKFEVGVEFGATWSKTKDRSGYTTQRQQVEGFDGWESTEAWTFLFAPFVRYNYLHSGRWTAFCEASVNFSLTPNARRHVYTSAYTLFGTDHPEVDADNLNYSYHSSSLGVTVVPGVSFAITERLSADLYIDLLGLGFIHSRETTFNNYATSGSAENTSEVTSIGNRFYLTADASPHDITSHLNLFRMGFSVRF